MKKGSGQHARATCGAGMLPAGLFLSRSCSRLSNPSRFALLDQLTENRQLLVHGGTGTGKTWHALELDFRHARQERYPQDTSQSVSNQSAD